MNVSLYIVAPLLAGLAGSAFACTPAPNARPTTAHELEVRSSPSPSPTSSSATSRTSSSWRVEQDGQRTPDSAAALSAPPGLRGTVLNEPTARLQPIPEVSQTPPTPSTPAPSTPPSMRPSTILAPARSGRIRRAVMLRVIHAHADEVSACYADGLRIRPELEGDVAVRFLIGPDGRVEQAEVYQSSLGDPGVEQCIAAAFSTWRFPRPRPRGRSVLATYPYHLSTD